MSSWDTPANGRKNVAVLPSSARLMPPGRSRSKRSRSVAWYPSASCPRSPRGRLAKKGIRCAKAIRFGGLG
eukprot:4753050-Alexandrium_andersonii.AAC.1